MLCAKYSRKILYGNIVEMCIEVIRAICAANYRHSKRKCKSRIHIC
ncbi:MAG: hypothetical protein IJ599_03845 [Alphaproteobacteria bacterium]|nr:hypothetical protein [Alphaproteobacteria bacterium]